MIGTVVIKTMASEANKEENAIRKKRKYERLRAYKCFVLAGLQANYWTIFSSHAIDHNNSYGAFGITYNEAIGNVLSNISYRTENECE